MTPAAPDLIVSRAPAAAAPCFQWSCTHCGLACPGKYERLQSAADTAFCCEGCRTVHAIITGCSLDRYYALKKNSASLGQASPASPGTVQFGYLDDAAVIEKYAYGRSRGTMDFFVEGVHCVACLWLLERLGTVIPDVAEARMDLGSRVLRVTLAEGGSFAAAAGGIDRLGYKPHPVFEDRQTVRLQKSDDRRELLRIGIAAFCMMNIMIFFVSVYGGAQDGLRQTFLRLSGLLYLPLGTYCAWPFYRSAWFSLRARQIHIDLPVSGAILIGSIASYAHLAAGSGGVYFDSLASFIFLLSGARYLVRTVQRKAASHGGIGAFLIPASALRQDGVSGEVRAVPADQIAAGDLVRAPRGQTIAVDGEVAEGSGFADVHMLSGESLPVAVAVGSAVYAGTVNVGPDLLIRAAASGARTRIGRLLKEVLLAPKPPAVRTADLAAKFYLAAVMAAAAGLFWFGGGLGLGQSFDRALAMIIIACPCALALVTPLAYRLAAAEYGTAGILLKDPETLEKIAKAEHLFLDKTGTVTHGRFDVTSWTIVSGTSSLAGEALALEEASQHPIAHAVCGHARKLLAEEGGAPTAGGSAAGLTVLDRQENFGVGVSGRVGESFFEIRGIALVEQASDEKTIQSAVGIFHNGDLAVRIQLGDRIREDSAAAVALLRRQYRAVTLLTGDREAPAAAVGRDLGLDDVRARMSPEDKRDIIQNTPKSLFAGDGANDAAAMSEAWVSVAVQGSIEASLQCADAYLAIPGIGAIADLTAIARRTAAAVRWALGLSLIYNIAGMWLALAGHVHPLVAAVAMPVSSVTVLAVTYAMIRRPAPAGRKR